MDPVLFSPQRAPKRVQPEMDTMGLPVERLCFPEFRPFTYVQGEMIEINNRNGP